MTEAVHRRRDAASAARALRAVALVLVALATTLCAQEPGSPQPPPRLPAAPRTGDAVNLVIVTLDTLRADHVGCYGYFRDTTPTLDALAKESLRFTRCYAPIAHTTPSHASLFTSVHPFEHGITANSVLKSEEKQRDAAFHPSPTLQPLAQVLAAHGVKTGGFVSAAPVKRITGLAVGFDAWTEPAEHRRPAHETIADALHWLDSVGDARFFLWVHLFDAHGPFDADYPPPGYRDRFQPDDALKAWMAARRFPAKVSGVNTDETDPAAVIDTYDGAVRYLDDQLAPLLARLSEPKLRANTLLVVTADHGQGLGQHDFVGHGVVWSEQLSVPLFVRLPAVVPAVVDVPMSTIDILPTVLGRVPGLIDRSSADETFARQLQGADVLAESFAPRAIFGMAPQRRSLLSFTTTRWRLIHAQDQAPQLFDLENDPFELADVAKQHADLVARLDKALLAEVERQKKREAIHAKGAASGASAPDPRHQLELEKLGYTTDGSDGGDERGGHR